MTIGIVGGTGDEGFGLALRLARAGEEIVIGSRSAERGEEAAGRARDLLVGQGARVEGTVNEDLAASCDPVFVTVPFGGQAATYKAIGSALRPGTVVCDTTSPLATAVGGRATQVLRPWEGSAGELAASLLPEGVRLVSGFHTVSGELLQDLSRPMEGDVPLCGNDRDAKEVIGRLVELIPSLRWVDAGPLSMARVVEPLTALMVSVNIRYRLHDTGLALTGRDTWGKPPPRAKKT